MYSLRMSFWTVPRRRAGSTPCRRRDRLVEGQQDGRGGVDGHRGARRAEGDPVEQQLHVGHAVDRHPDPAHLADGHRVVAVVAHLGRQVEGHREAGLAAVEEVAEAPVRLLRGAEAGVLAHGPGPPPVAVGADAARERAPRRAAELALRVEGGVRPVGGLDLDPRWGAYGARRFVWHAAPVYRRVRPAVRPRLLDADQQALPWRQPSPRRPTTLPTRPARGARTSFCIFMASMVSSVWPSATSSPSATPTATTRPGRVAVMSTGPPWLAAATSASASTRSRQLSTLTAMRRPSSVTHQCVPLPSTTTRRLRPTS